MGGSAPPPRQGRSSLDPSSGHTIRIFKQFAGVTPETIIAHGHGGYGRQPDALHPGKRKETLEEKACFLSQRFFVFIVPVKLLFRFLKLLAEKPRLYQFALSHTGVQRTMSSGAGVRGPRRPLPFTASPADRYR